MIHKYKIHCITENQDKYWNLEDGDPSPITCPTNTSHKIDLSSVTVVQIGQTAEVITQYEKNDKDLKLAKGKCSINQNGTAIVSIQIPGTFGSGDGRYVAGGYAISSDFNEDDYVTVHIEDTDRILATFLAQQINAAATVPLTDEQVQQLSTIPGVGNFPSYPVVKSYTDDELPIENQGWYFWANAQGNNLPPLGECEVEPIGGYGFIPSGMYIKITYQRPQGVNTGSMRVNFYWGKKE